MNGFCPESQKRERCQSEVGMICYISARDCYIRKIAATLTLCTLCYMIIALLVLYNNSRYLYVRKEYISVTVYKIVLQYWKLNIRVNTVVPELRPGTRLTGRMGDSSSLLVLFVLDFFAARLIKDKKNKREWTRYYGDKIVYLVGGVLIRRD